MVRGTEDGQDVLTWTPSQLVQSPYMELPWVLCIVPSFLPCWQCSARSSLQKGDVLSDASLLVPLMVSFPGTL